MPHYICGFHQPGMEFLSNFYPCDIWMDGVKYPSVEHAFQAAKTLDPDERRNVASQPTPGKAKAAGRKVSLRPDWDGIKISVMRDLVSQKFLGLIGPSQLLYRLQETGESVLIEGNNWGDTFWGVDGHGFNHLGEILMDIRDGR